MSTFTVDEAGILAHFDDFDPDDMPYIGLEYPSRDLEQLMSDLGEFIAKPEKYCILVYPLIYDSDPDGVLIAVGGPWGHSRYLATSPMDCTDIVDRSDFEQNMTAARAVEIVNDVVRYANELLDGLLDELIKAQS